MIFSFLSGMSHGAILLVIEPAPLVEDDEDACLSSVARVLIKTFYCTHSSHTPRSPAGLLRRSSLSFPGCHGIVKKGEHFFLSFIRCYLVKFYQIQFGCGVVIAE